MAALATKTGVEGRQALGNHTPLIAMSKAEIIAKGIELGVDYSLTSRCYRAIAHRRALRAMRFLPAAAKRLHENGIVDPLRYGSASP